MVLRLRHTCETCEISVRRKNEAGKPMGYCNKFGRWLEIRDMSTENRCPSWVPSPSIEMLVKRLVEVKE